MRRAGIGLLLLVGLAAAVRAEELKNWFGDPFFQVRQGVPACPVPRGPLITEDEMRRSAHARIERGTGCWQEGKCTKPNSYMYDGGIADEVKRRFEASRALGAASLWVTVQRRIVFVEGCAAQPDAAERIRGILRGVEDVQQVVVNVVRDPSSRSPYVALPGR